MARRKTICLDFDGVMHSYSSGWKGARNIPDPPVPGALEWLCKALARFDVAIYSSRSHQFGGRRAMKRWLRRHLASWVAGLGTDAWCDICDTVQCWPLEGSLAEDADWLAWSVVRRVQWPNHKPSAHYSIDDRGAQFSGDWDAFKLDTIEAFRPWNRR